ncbi:MAG: 1-deoxy-D-xylulose-5-phosphate synthase [bacterium]
MNNVEQYPLLSQVETPDQLRQLAEEQLPDFADELRRYLIQSVSSSGGHFGAGLGCVELTVALHYVYNTPDDRIVWDVGHQAYPHKILTGRRDQITTIKKKDGLNPFPKRTESIYDNFGVGHSSTSISASLGMALAHKITHEDRRSVAIIGDGAMTAGMAYEALNHGGELDPNMLVVLNENHMSISPNIGGMTKVLSRLASSNIYTQVRERSKKLMRKDSATWRFMSRWEEHMKGMFVPSTLFEELGFNYFGPVDGHDLPQLVRAMRTLKSLEGPQLLHIVTTKGKGYQPAEADPVKYHAVGPFDPELGVVAGKASTAKSYTDVFSDWICDMATKDEKLVAITPAMREGSGLVKFAAQFPDRYFDVGIAEQHAVTLAAGMACDGLRPVVAIYSTFLQRAYDQLIHDVALQNLPVTFAIDRAGLVGPDGPTHAGSFDLSFLRCIPNMLIMAPSNENECRQMLYTAQSSGQPAAVRYPRGKGPGTTIQTEMTAIPIGQAEIIREGSGIALLAFGSMVNTCVSIAEQLNATLVNMRFVKPLDQQLIMKLSEQNDWLITVEENAIAGGAGSGINELLAGTGSKILNIGLPDFYSKHGSREEVLHECGLDASSILRQIQQKLGPVLSNATAS